MTTNTWTGKGDGTTFSDGANWSTGAAPTALAGGGETGAGTLTLKGAATSSGFSVAGGASLMVGGSLDMTKALILGGAAGTGKLGILAGGLVDLSGAASITVESSSTATLANSGTLEKADGGLTATVSVAISNFGTILAASGVINFTAAVSGPGKIVVQSGATIEFDAAEAGALSFGSGGGTLWVGSAASFKGAITGLGGTGTRLDLAGFGTGTNDTYTANSQGTGSTLKLVDGSKTTSLTLVGSYTAGGFHLPNGSTDTLVSYTAPATTAAHPATTAVLADTMPSRQHCSMQPSAAARSTLSPLTPTMDAGMIRDGQAHIRFNS